jgi:hypothetical protein
LPSFKNWYLTFDKLEIVSLMLLLGISDSASSILSSHVISSFYHLIFSSHDIILYFSLLLASLLLLHVKAIVSY